MKKKIICMAMILVMAMLALSGCKIRNYDSNVVDINNGEDGIKLGYVNFVFKYTQAGYDINYGSSYGTRLWTDDMTGTGQPFSEEVKNNVVETLEKQYIIKKHADEMGVTITEDDKTKINEATSKFLSENTSSTLNAMGADEDVVRQMLTDMTYVSKIEKALEARGKAEGAINDTTDATTYVNNVVASWEAGYEFNVDDKLLSQITVDDMFATSSSSNSTSKASTTTTSNSNQGK